MNVQTLITQMLVGMGEGHHKGTPLKTMKDLYLCFERDINAIVDHVSRRGGPVTQGVVFAELLDAVEETKVSLRTAMESAREKLAAEDAAREAEALANATKAAETAKTTTRRRRRTAAEIAADNAAAAKATGTRKRTNVKPAVGRKRATTRR